MPLTSSAKKALRASKRKKVFNIKRKDALKTAVKDVRKLAVEKGTNAVVALASAYKAIDKAAKRGVIKKNTANRKKSRLAKLFKKA